MRMTRLTGAVFACVITLVTTSTFAALYDNIDPGNIDPGTGWATGDLASYDYAPGFLFTAQNSGVVSGIDAIFQYHTGPGNLTLGLYTDNGGAISTLLEEVTISVTSNQASIVSSPASGATFLTTGNQYWLVASFAGDGGFFSWLQNTTGDIGTRADSRNNLSGPFIYSTQTLGAFRITAVPIPPALWLFGSGLLGLVGMARHKKAA